MTFAVAAAVTSMIAGSAVLGPDQAKQPPATAIPIAQGALTVGAFANPERLHVISRPGLYGIGDPPAGSGYGVLDGRLIRYDLRTGMVQAVIRQVDETLD